MPKDNTNRKTAPRLVRSLTKRSATLFYTFNDLPPRYNRAVLTGTRIGGDSLEDAGIPRGYMVAVATDRTVVTGDLVMAVKDSDPNGDAPMVGYLFFGPGGWIRLQSANRADYPDQIYAPGEVRIVGPVVHAEPHTPYLTAQGVNRGEK